ncbi:MAG: hypothetical protein HY675_10620 [Chloroflexi bacterium]|nr:hypothetical protein [Chloroflexota bacterium]
MGSIATKRFTRTRNDLDGLRIGLVADTHEAQDPVSLIRRLGELGCDYHIHLGDIGGSRLASTLVREFKQRLGNMEHLSREEMHRFDQLKQGGMTPIWAYIETRLGSDPASRSRRVQETQHSYDTVVSEMSKLPATVFISGNIDKSLIKTEVVAPSFARHNARLVVEPSFIDIGATLAVLWPSIKATESQQLRRLEENVSELLHLAENKARVIVFAHEQLFKGPHPPKYKANAEAAGHTPMTVPYFEPNPSWKLLLHFLRTLPPTVGLAFVHGHVHDPQDVIQAGAPYMKGTLSEGLMYRLYGLGTPASCHGAIGRRTLRIFTVPANQVAVLGVGPDGVKFEVLAS